jgi:hypothetical protein
MSIKQKLCLELDLTVYNTEEIDKAREFALESNGVLYCWKTSGISNWLEKGLSMVDVLGVVVLPRGLPDQIDMPDDESPDA